MTDLHYSNRSLPYIYYIIFCHSHCLKCIGSIWMGMLNIAMCYYLNNKPVRMTHSNYYLCIMSIEMDMLCMLNLHLWNNLPCSSCIPVGKCTLHSSKGSFGYLLRTLMPVSSTQQEHSFCSYLILYYIIIKT